MREHMRRRADGARSHEAILDAAMAVASVDGINGLTLGRLAKRLGISKSGLYAHFDSKLDLQLQVIEAATAVFVQEVIQPVITAEQGLPRLLALPEAYLSYVERKVFPGGCFFAGVMAEVDAQTGPVRDQLAGMTRMFEGLVVQTVKEAQDRGEIRADVDPSELYFQIYAALELGNYLFMLFDDPEQIGRARTAARSAIEAARTIPP